MKRCFMFLLIISMFLAFVSCESKGVDCISPVTVVLDFDDVFEMSKNVYTGTLLGYEKNTTSNLEYKLKFQVDCVFKGEYYQNDIVEDTLVSSMLLYEECAEFIVGERYLYMSGVDLNYKGEKNSWIDYFEKEPYFKIIRIGDNGELYQAADYYDGTSVFNNQFLAAHYNELVGRMLPLEPMNEFYKKNGGKSLIDVYDKSENVYIARVINYKTDESDSTEIDTALKYMADLEVKSVIKGNRIPKELVTDEIVYYSGSFEWYKEYYSDIFVLVMSDGVSCTDSIDVE